MDYDLYHDESKVDGYWHGMLLIPNSAKKVIFTHLQEARIRNSYMSPIHFADVKKKDSPIGRCATDWASLCPAFLMQKFKGREPYRVLHRNKPEYSESERSAKTHYKKIFEIKSNNEIIGAKFLLFKEKDSFKKMYTSSYKKKVISTLRMGMLGGIHYLANTENPVNIKSLHFDGWEHHGTHITMSEIKKKIDKNREYFSIDDACAIFDNSSDHTKEGSQSYVDCQFLQLCDLLVSGFRSLISKSNSAAKQNILNSFEEILKKWDDRRMRNSKWNGGFWMSECHLESGGWKFNDLRSSSHHPTLLI